MSRVTKIACATGGLFLVLLYFQALSPLALDDFTFKNLLYDPSRIIGFAIRQFEKWDGRLTGYVLNLTILSVPRWMADVFLALTPLGLMYAMLMHVFGPQWRQRITWWHPLAVFCLLWLSIPDFGQAFFWKTGSPYSIIVFLYLLLLWPYRLLAEQGRYTPWVFYAVIPLAAFCGLADFHNTLMVAGLTLAVSLFHTARGGRGIAPYITPLVLLACFVIIYTAPGNGVRIRTTMPEFLEQSRWAFIAAHLARQGSVQFLYFWEYLLMAIAALMLWRAPRAAAALSLPARLAAHPTLCVALVFFLAAQAVQLIFMFAPPAEPRVFTSSVIFMIIAALAFARHAADDAPPAACRTLRRGYWWAAGLVCVFHLLQAAVMYAEMDAYVTASERAFCDATLKDHVRVPAGPYRSGPYLFNGHNFSVQEQQCWGNVQMSRYYEVYTIRLHPQYFALRFDDREAAGGARFEGKVERSQLDFVYTPDAADAQTPFSLVFLPVPLDAVRKYGVPWLERHLSAGGDALLAALVRQVYVPLSLDARREGERYVGQVRVPRLEHTDHGYIVHTDPQSGAVTKLIRLRIER